MTTWVCQRCGSYAVSEIETSDGLLLRCNKCHYEELADEEDEEDD